MLFTAALSVWLAPCAAQTQPPQTQWLVLNNDQFIKGKILKRDGRYQVATATGSKILIEETKVRLVADSLDDIYWEMWSRTDPENEQQQAKLFRWCVRNGLLHRAQPILHVLAGLDGTSDTRDRLLTRLSAELNDAVQKRLKQQQTTAAPKAQLADAAAPVEIRGLPSLDPPAAQPKIVNRIPRIPSLESTTLPAVSLTADGEIRRVGHEEAVEPEKKTLWRPEKHLIKQAIRNLPHGAARFYKVKIEHELLSNCAQCHGLDTEAFPLAKSDFGKKVHAWMTRQNIYSALLTTDRNFPAQSPLIEMATQAHGGQPQAAFGHSDPFVIDLKNWLAALSGVRVPTQTPTPPQQEATTLTPAKPAESPSPGAVNRIPKAADPYDPSEFNNSSR